MNLAQFWTATGHTRSCAQDRGLLRATLRCLQDRGFRRSGEIWQTFAGGADDHHRRRHLPGRDPAFRLDDGTAPGTQRNDHLQLFLDPRRDRPADDARLHAGQPRGQ